MEIEGILRAWITIFALVLLIIALISYRRFGNKRFLIVGTAFALFFVKGIMLSIEFFESGECDTSFSSLFDALVLILLFFAIWKT